MATITDRYFTLTRPNPTITDRYSTLTSPNPTIKDRYSTLTRPNPTIVRKYVCWNVLYELGPYQWDSDGKVGKPDASLQHSADKLYD